MSATATHWPFPGQAHLPAPAHDLPPARFAVGDLVKTRWGTATVLRVCDWPGVSGRSYLVKHSWSTAPEGYGHHFGEDDIELLAKAEPAPIHKPASAPQLDLFS